MGLRDSSLPRILRSSGIYADRKRAVELFLRRLEARG
jgi:hypothetical protein